MPHSEDAAWSKVIHNNCDRICEKGPYPAFSQIFRILAIFKLSYFHYYSWQQNNSWYRTNTNLQL